MISKAEINSLFDEAYALKQGEYAELPAISPPPEICANIGMCNIGRTNATSTIRYIGTSEVISCLAVGVYNRTTHSSVVTHINITEETSFAEMRSCMESIIGCAGRKDYNDPLDVHIIGGTNSYVDGRGRVKQDLKTSVFRTLVAGLLQVVKEHPQAVLKTCDIDDKPHPSAFALDSHDGQLIACSPLEPAPWREDIPFYPSVERWPEHPSPEEKQEETNVRIISGALCFDGGMKGPPRHPHPYRGR